MLYNYQAVNEAGGGGEAGRVLGRDAVRVRETQRGGVGVGVRAELPKDLHREDPEVRAPEPCQGDGANPQGRQRQQQQVVVLVLRRRLAWHGHADMDMCSALLQLCRCSMALADIHFLEIISKHSYRSLERISDSDTTGSRHGGACGV